MIGRGSRAAPCLWTAHQLPSFLAPNDKERTVEDTLLLSEPNLLLPRIDDNLAPRLLVERRSSSLLLLLPLLLRRRNHLETLALPPRPRSHVLLLHLLLLLLRRSLLSLRRSLPSHLFLLLLVLILELSQRSLALPLPLLRPLRRLGDPDIACESSVVRVRRVHVAYDRNVAGHGEDRGVRRVAEDVERALLRLERKVRVDLLLDVPCARASFSPCLGEGSRDGDTPVIVFIFSSLRSFQGFDGPSTGRVMSS